MMLTLSAVSCNAPAVCLEYADATATGVLTFEPLAEISGLVASQGQPGVLWAHADSGDEARLYAIGHDGAPIATYELAGVTAIDWEDIAIGPGFTPGSFDLYIGDIGNNGLTRDTVTIYRIAEPIVPAEPTETIVSLDDAEAFELTYPLAPAIVYDAESLFVDPLDAAIYLVSKDSENQDNGFSYVFTPLIAPVADSVTPLMQVAALEFGTGFFDKVTGADMPSDGMWIGIRTYAKVFGWARMPGVSIADALSGTRCQWPRGAEIQGEAFAFAAEMPGYYTASEQFVFGPQNLYFYGEIQTGEGEGELPPHSADTNADYALDLGEVLRVVQLYNFGNFACATEASGSEDGYAFGTGDFNCSPHDADYLPQDWSIRLTELLRVIQLFQRGGYVACPTVGEDGFCAAGV